LILTLIHNFKQLLLFFSFAQFSVHHVHSILCNQIHTGNLPHLFAPHRRSYPWSQPTVNT